MSGSGSKGPAKKLSRRDHSQSSVEESNSAATACVQFTLPPLPSDAEKSARMEAAYKTSLSNRKELSINFPSGLQKNEEWTYSCTDNFMGWNWKLTVYNEKAESGAFLVRRYMEVVPSAPNGSRMQKCIECYANITLEGEFAKPQSSRNPPPKGSNAFGHGGTEKSDEKEADNGGLRSRKCEVPRYYYWYPTGTGCQLSVDQEAFAGFPGDFTADFFTATSKGAVTLTVGLFDVQYFDAIDFSVPPELEHQTAFDCVLVCENEKKLYCNSAILAEGAAYFRKLFFESDFKEKKDMVVSLSDIDCSEMYDFVSMLHKQYSPITDANVISRMALCDRFEAVLCAQRCETHLCTRSQFSVERKLTLAQQFRLYALRRHVINDMADVESIYLLKKSSIYRLLEDRTKTMLFERLMQLQEGHFHHRVQSEKTQDRENDDFYCTLPHPC